MGFAAGINAGTALVSRALENERLQRAEGRTQKTFEDAQADRAAQDKAIADLQWPGQTGLNTTSPVTPVPNAPPTSVAATQGDGVPPVAPAGVQLAQAAGLQGPPVSAANAGVQGSVPTPDPGLQGPPAAAAPAAPAAAGLQPPGNAAATAPAAAPAAPEMSPEKKFAQGLFNLAKAKRDVKGMTEAVEQYHTAARKDIVNDAGKMTDDDAFAYVHDNITKVGSMPMSVVKEGKDGYRVMAWNEDGSKGASPLLSSSEVKKLVAADKMMKLGYAAEGLELAGSVDKSLNAIIKEYNAGNKDMATVSNTVAHNRITAAETERSHRANEGNAAANTAISRDRLSMDKDAKKAAAEREKAGDYMPTGISADGKSIEVWDHKLNRKATVPVSEGMDPKEQFKLMRASRTKGGEDDKITYTANGGYIKNGDAFIPDPKKDGAFKKVELGDSALTAAVKADIAAAAKGGKTEKPGLPVPAAAPPAAPAAAAPPAPQPGLPLPSARPLVQGSGPDAFNQQLQARRASQVAAQEAVRSDPEVVQLYQQYSQASGRNAAMARSQLEQLIQQRYHVGLSEAGL